MSNPNDKDAFRDWAQQQMQAMGKHLATHGLISRDEIRVEARWNYPFRVLIAQAWGSKDEARKFWVIAGDVPVDHIEGAAASDARGALKHFAMRWQVKGARVKSADRDLAAPQAERSKLRINWTEVGDTLADQAEFIYALAEDDRNWESTMRM